MTFVGMRVGIVGGRSKRVVSTIMTGDECGDLAMQGGGEEEAISSHRSKGVIKSHVILMIQGGG